MPTLHTSLSERDFHQGDLNAPIQLVHFGDFECPYSGALYGSIKQIQTEEGGNLLYVFRQFPLSDLHPHALIAAHAAYAANEQGQFWPMYDLLFQNQKALGPASLKMYARDLGLDTERFEAEMRADKYSELVANNIADAKASGAHGTPTLYINGQFHDNDEKLWKINRLREVLKIAR